jgi:hypothetical protein
MELCLVPLRDSGTSTSRSAKVEDEEDDEDENENEMPGEPRLFPS